MQTAKARVEKLFLAEKASEPSAVNVSSGASPNAKPGSPRPMTSANATATVSSGCAATPQATSRTEFHELAALDRRERRAVSERKSAIRSFDARRGRIAERN